ncbi:organic cation transporter protein-like [Battus philenor]|uniref:organic cation transporter protein-like n=1 Tax=Battus philenor TaxID=42288 RepID=UPI0035CF4816
MAISKNETNENNETEIRDTMEKLGRYQIIQYAFSFIGTLVVTLSHINYVFIAGDLDYRCRIPECEDESSEFKPVWWPSGTIDRCTRPVSQYPTPTLGQSCTNESFTDTVEMCTEWVYESNDTVIAEFNLACKPWMSNMIGTTHSIGILIVMIVAGWMSDRFGRKPVFIFCCVGSCIGYFKGYAPSYYVYVGIELLEAVITGGTYGTISILMIEISGKKNRLLAGIIFAYSIYMGESVYAIIAKFVPNWKNLIKILYCPPIIFLSYIYFMKESPRWQIINGKFDDAKAALLYISKMNKVNINEQKLAEMGEKELKKEFNITNNKHKETIKDAFKSKEIMKRVTIGAFSRFSACVVYYGLMINSVFLPGDKYMNFFLSSIMSYPGDLMALYLMNKVGRKSPLIYGFVLCGLLCAASVCVPDDVSWLKITLFLLGKMIASGCFIGVVAYAIELVPTSVRGTLLGISGLTATFGNVLAPLTPLLATVSVILPPLIFGVLAITSGLLLTLTPETKDLPLAETVEQVEYEVRLRKSRRKENNLRGQDNPSFENRN